MAIALHPLDLDANHPVVQSVTMASKPNPKNILGIGVRDEISGKQELLTLRGDAAHLLLLARSVCEVALGESHPATQEVGKAMVQLSSERKAE